MVRGGKTLKRPQGSKASWFGSFTDKAFAEKTLADLPLVQSCIIFLCCLCGPSDNDKDHVVWLLTNLPPPPHPSRKDLPKKMCSKGLKFCYLTMTKLLPKVSKGFAQYPSSPFPVGTFLIQRATKGSILDPSPLKWLSRILRF